MADYLCWARTNYFAVKDPDAFRAAMADFSVEVITDQPVDASSPLYGLLCDTENGWPTTRDDHASGEDEDVDFAALVADHLADDHVAVFVESGHQKLRYVGGCALAINGKGERRQVDLEEIYDRATCLGTIATRATE